MTQRKGPTGKSDGKAAKTTTKAKPAKAAAGKAKPAARAASTRGASPRPPAKPVAKPVKARPAKEAREAKEPKDAQVEPAHDPRPARARDVDDTPFEPRTDTAGLEGALAALTVALDKKALEPVLLDVRELCSYCNYQLVVSGRSDRQVDAISEGIQVGLKQDGRRPLSSEGLRSGQWALLDYGDFVVHVFHHPVREHYDLESLWSDAPRVPIEVPANARIGIDEAY